MATDVENLQLAGSAGSPPRAGTPLPVLRAAGIGPGTGAGGGIDTGSDVGLANTRDTLLQLCGELLLQPVPSRPPTISRSRVRSRATIGLELLDLLLNPDHVLRVTEELTLRNTLVLERRVQLDISLDGLSRQQEEGAAQLSALVSSRAGLPEATRVGPERLWMPLDTVPRPVSVAVTVRDTDGTPLPRPPQPTIRSALAAALDHILVESLRAHPDVDVPEHAAHLVMRSDPARWLLESALRSVAEEGQGSRRSQERLQALGARCAGVDPSALPDAEVPGLVAGLVAGLASVELSGSGSRSGSGRHALSPHQVALAVVHDVLLPDGPFLELLRLVHRHYFVVAGLDPYVRDHVVRYDLPEAEALPTSAIRSLHRRLRTEFDPREHNYSAHIVVPLPDNVDQYELCVYAAAEGRAAHNEVSLVGALQFDGHPAQSALEALSVCADALDAVLALTSDVDPAANPAADAHGGNGHDAGDPGDASAGRRSGEDEPGDGRDEDGDPGGGSAPGEVAARKLAYIASQAAPALDRLDAVVGGQSRATDELEARAGRASTRLVKQLFGRLHRTTAAAHTQLAVTRQALGDLVTCLRRGEVRADEVRATTAAIRDVIRAAEHPLLARRLVSSELTGREVGRIRLSRTTMATPDRQWPRTLEVWATVSDESRPYPYEAVGPPLGLALLVYLTGTLLFDTAAWPVHVARLAGELISTRQADAIVAVLLLIPGFALTQFRPPHRWSVSGWLHRPGHLFVLVATLALGITSILVATQVGGQSAELAHPHIVLWAFRSALGVFATCSLWAVAAALLRKRYSWRPKGLRALLDVGVATAPPATRLGARLSGWLSRSTPARLCDAARYRRKPPDADFDLTQPSRAAHLADDGEGGQR